MGMLAMLMDNTLRLARFALGSMTNLPQMWVKREHLADLVDSKPPVDSCPFTAMGFKDNSGFPRELFSI